MFFIIFQGCSNPDIESRWQSTKITIDGNNQDWRGSLTYFEDEKVAIGVSNDNNFVCFCLATSDNAKIMKILRTGFKVWLDPQNSDGETMGIQYPIKREVACTMNKSPRGMNNGEKLETTLIKC